MLTPLNFSGVDALHVVATLQIVHTHAQALALGADAVLIGRPILWGLTLAGEEGVRKVLETIRKELRLSMALMGCPTIKHLQRKRVITPWDQYPDARL